MRCLTDGNFRPKVKQGGQEAAALITFEPACPPSIWRKAHKPLAYKLHRKSIFILQDLLSFVIFDG